MFTIGLLDTPGFENFNKNSLEQLTFNTLNEEIQKAFYRHSFDYDQQTYQKEGLMYPPVIYKDNKKTCDLLLEVPTNQQIFN